MKLARLVSPLFLLLLCSPLSAAQSSPRVPAPREILGFDPGADRRLASWGQVLDYFRALDRASDRVRFAELGRTTLGAPFVMATISAPENLARLDEIKSIQAQLADPRRLGPEDGRDRRAADLIARGKTIVLITCGVHSTEVGSYLSSMLIAHRLASSDEPEVRDVLQNTVVLLVPSLNPDGVEIVKRWYDRTLGTPFEGTTPPELYHKYVGHDNNRDWYAFTQRETQLTVDLIHNVWRPQIVHDIHQQGPYGARLFVPPYMRPVEPNVPEEIIAGYTDLGNYIARQMRAAGFRGITTNSSYDAWTPARAYSHYHGGVRILSETASARLATPLVVPFADLRASEGYDARRASPEFPEVWPGGEWRLADITRYMTTAAFHLLTHAARNRENWLRNFYAIGREAVRPRRAGELFGFRLAPGANSAALLDVLRRGGVEAAYGEPAPGGTRSIIVPLAQPYGAFAKALLERQQYPDLRDAAGAPQRPYDVTAHTLALLFGVEATPLDQPVKTSGRYVPPVEAKKQGTAPAARVAIYRSHVPSMDEGWTRWVCEREGVRYATLADREARAGKLRARYDAILIPDQSADALLNGHAPGTMPDEYVGGLGTGGREALREFVEEGGRLILLNRASDFVITGFGLPLRDLTDNFKRTEFYVPGSILRLELDTQHPVAAGMPRDAVAWVEDSPVFEVSDGAQNVRVIARYPQSADPLLSGWLLGGEKLTGRAALVEVRMGRGHIYLFGFRPQYRGQSRATFPLLFNALQGGF